MNTTRPQVKLRQILSSALYARLPYKMYRRTPVAAGEDPPDPIDPVSVFAKIPLAALTYAVDHPLPPNYVWKPSIPYPTQLEAWSPNLKEGATSTSLRVVWKDCWDRWEKFTGWGLEQTNQILQGCST